MKLLFDQNLSPSLVISLADLFPDSEHVSRIGLSEADDFRIWSHAKQNRLAIVTKDSDFSDFSQIYDSPPKVIWLRLGNCTTKQIEKALRSRHQKIMFFLTGPDSTVIAIFP